MTRNHPLSSENVNAVEAATIELARKMPGREAKEDLTIWDIVKNAQSLVKFERSKLELNGRTAK